MSDLSQNPRATLAAWVRYADIILAAKNNYPREFVFKPKNMAPSTIASRLRDAIRGAIEFDYGINRTELRDWWDKVVVRNDFTNVYIGPREQKKEPLEALVSDSGFSFGTLSCEETHAFATLIQNGRIRGPVRIQKPSMDVFLPTHPNLQVLYQKDGSLILL